MPFASRFKRDFRRRLCLVSLEDRALPAPLPLRPEQAVVTSYKGEFKSLVRIDLQTQQRQVIPIGNRLNFDQLFNFWTTVGRNGAAYTLEGGRKEGNYFQDVYLNHVDLLTGQQQIVRGGPVASDQDVWDLRTTADGKILVVAGSLPFGNLDLILVDPKTGHRVVRNTGPETQYSVAPAPDGSVYLLKQHFLGTGDWNLTVNRLDMNTGAQTVISNSPALYDFNPGFLNVTPDGTVLLNGTPNQGHGPMEVLVIHPSGGGSGSIPFPPNLYTAAMPPVSDDAALILDNSGGISQLDLVTGAVVAVAPTSLIPDGGVDIDPLPFRTDIRMADATTKVDSTSRAAAFKTISIRYAIDGLPVIKDFAFRAYLSDDVNFDTNNDMQVAGETLITKAADKKIGDKHLVKLELKTPAAITKDHRFILVVADATEQITEQDEDELFQPMGKNNAMFVIPILQRGFFRPGGQFGTSGAKESSVVGDIHGYIARGTDDANNLFDFRYLWTDIVLANGTIGSFPNNQFPPSPYQNDNYFVNPAMAGPLNVFKDLILLADDAGRLDGLKFLQVNAAFNEDGRHSPYSSHYEGRAFDFVVNSATLARTMVGLGVLAGFGWADFEKSNHLHFSVSSKGGYNATVSPAPMIQAIDWGHSNGLIVDDDTYAKLRGYMEILQNQVITNQFARQQITAFLAAVTDGVRRGTIQKGFARGRVDASHYTGPMEQGLLRFNGTILLGQYPV